MSDKQNLFPSRLTQRAKRRLFNVESTLEMITQTLAKAFALGNTIEYNKLRNKVIHVVKQAKSKYFESQVNHLKNSKPRKWWSAIKNLAGFSLKPAFHSAEVNGTILQGRDLALAVNNGFLAATKFQLLINYLWKNLPFCTLSPLLMSNRV